MVDIREDAQKLRISYSPRFFLGAYLVFIFAMVVLSARFAARGQQQEALWMLVLGLTVGLASVLLFIEGTDMVFDREANRVTLRARRAFGAKAQSFALADIRGAENETPFSRDRGTNHRPVLIKQDGSRIALRRVYMSRRHSVAMVTAINRWLAGEKP